MGSFLVRSLVLSIALTVVLNVVIRLFARPGGEPGRDRPRSSPPPRWIGGGSPDGERARPRVRVIVPWKLMLVGSLLLTVALNLLATRR